MPAHNDALTLVKDAIHNPAEPRHFMRIAPVACTVTAVIGEVQLARSTRTLKVKEVGRDIYDPVLYFPRADVAMAYLVRTDKTTHCPLKGDTEYFDGQLPAGRIGSIAWSYDRTLDIARELEGYIAFDTRQVQVTELTVRS